MMIQQFLASDVFETYGYFYIDDQTQHGFLIDPGAEAEKLLDVIHQNGWVIEKILLTHGHFDHTGAVEKLSQTLQIPYMIHRDGRQYLTDPKLNLSAYCKRCIVLEDALYFEDGDVIRLNNQENFYLKVLHTPGHTPDSVVFYNEKDQAAFVGDTIFRGSIGNAGYPGGNMTKLQDSIWNRIFKLPGETRLYPGHSEATTVNTEMRRYTKVQLG